MSLIAWNNESNNWEEFTPGSVVNVLGEYMLFPPDFELPLIGGGAPATGAVTLAYDPVYPDYLVAILATGAGGITRIAVPTGATTLTITLRVRATTAPGATNVAFAVASRPIGSAWSAELARGTSLLSDATSLVAVAITVPVASLGGSVDDPLAIEVYRVEALTAPFGGDVAWYSTRLAWT